MPPPSSSPRRPSHFWTVHLQANGQEMRQEGGNSSCNPTGYNKKRRENIRWLGTSSISPKFIPFWSRGKGWRNSGASCLIPPPGLIICLVILEIRWISSSRPELLDSRVALFLLKGTVLWKTMLPWITEHRVVLLTLTSGEMEFEHPNQESEEIDGMEHLQISSPNPQGTLSDSVQN